MYFLQPCSKHPHDPAIQDLDCSCSGLPYLSAQKSSMDCNGPHVSHPCELKLNNLLSDQPSTIAESYCIQQLAQNDFKDVLREEGVMSRFCIHGQLQHLHNKHKKGSLQAQLITLKNSFDAQNLNFFHVLHCHLINKERANLFY